MVSSDYFFEGVEKLLEIWFAPDTEENQDGDLKKIPRSEWDSLVKSVNAQILSVIENDDIQARDLRTGRSRIRNRSNIY